MKNRLAFIVAFVGLVFPLKAQETAKPAESPATIDQILEKYERALGKKATAEKFKTIYMKGSLEVTSAGLSGSIEIFSKAPNKQATLSDLPNYGTVKNVFNGTEGWMEYPNEGISNATGIQLAEMRRNSDLLREYRLK